MLSRVCKVSLVIILIGEIGYVFWSSWENIKYCKEQCHKSPTCRDLMTYRRDACSYLETERIRRLMGN